MVIGGVFVDTQNNNVQGVPYFTDSGPGVVV